MHLRRRLVWRRPARPPGGRAWLCLAGVVALGALGVWAVVAAAVGGFGEQRHPLLPPGQALAASVSVGPRSAFFGDAIDAHVSVAADPALIAPGSLAFRFDVRPYSVAGRSRSTRHIGGQVLVDEHLRLQCTSGACLPFGGRRRVALPPTLIRYRLRTGAGGQALAEWPALAVGSRISAADVRHAAFALRAAALASPSARVDPGTLAVLLLSAAALAGLAGTALLAIVLVPSRGPATTVPPLPPASTLHRALAPVRRLAGRRRPGPDGSWALERLATVLDDAGHADLGEHARTLAWSPEGLPLGAVTQLVEACAAPERQRPP